MNTSRPVSLAPALILEDDPASRTRLQRLLEAEAPADAPPYLAGSIAEGLQVLQCHPIAFTLVDIGLPDGDGVQFIEHALHIWPDITCMVVSAWGHESIVLKALRAGATGYLMKEAEDIELTLSLRAIARGGAPIDPRVAGEILRTLADPARQDNPQAGADTLSQREIQILSLLARGYSNREIAERIALSHYTVEDYTKRIYRKLAVGSRTEAVFKARTKGLLT